MFLSEINGFVVLHAGTPVEVSQATLAIMLVVLAITLTGIGFGRLAEKKTSLGQHRWNLTVAVILTLVAVFLVMIPAAFGFYIDPDLKFFEAVSITTLIHASVGCVAVVTALIYVFGDLPVSVRKWMRITAVLWISALILGVLTFLQMLSLI